MKTSVKKDISAAKTEKKKKGLLDSLLELFERVKLLFQLKNKKKEMAGTDNKSKTPDTAQKTITFEKMYKDGICTMSMIITLEKSALIRQCLSVICQRSIQNLQLRM